LCLPTDNDSQGRVWLLVNEDQRLDRIVKQLLKLEDIRDVQRRSIDRDLFIQLERFFWPSVTV
jgi:acetolactate synthase-1/3 small subunit